MNTEEEPGTGEYHEEELIKDSLDSTLLSSHVDYLGEASPETQAYGSTMSQNDLELLLSELFGNVKVDSFGIEWILNSPGATEYSVREVYQFLKNKDVKDERIASHASLLGKDPDTLEKHYENLKGMGLTDSKIASQASLLGLSPDTLEKNYENLKGMGLTDSKIASQASLKGIMKV